MKYLPEEIEVWYIIPAIRREIAISLISNYRLPYEKVGKMLGVSKAAISQYVKGKRAAKIKLPEALMPKLICSCKSLSSEKTDSIFEIRNLLNHLRTKSLPCEVCGKIKEGILEDCNTIKFINGNYH